MPTRSSAKCESFEFNIIVYITLEYVFSHILSALVDIPSLFSVKKYSWQKSFFDLQGGWWVYYKLLSSGCLQRKSTYLWLFLCYLVLVWGILRFCIGHHFLKFLLFQNLLDFGRFFFTKMNWTKMNHLFLSNLCWWHAVLARSK